MDDYDDEDIALRLLYGEEEGIDELIKAYGRRVANVLKAKYPDIPEEDRLIALRHAAYKAVRATDKYDSTQGSMAAWFTVIADRCVIDMLRQGKTDFQKNIDDFVDLIADDNAPIPFSGEVEKSEIAPELIKALMDSVHELTEQLKNVAVADLEANGKANTADLAERLGLAQSTIRKYRERYRKELFSSIKKKGFDEMTRRAI
ncbi:MAG: hypothetical protein COA73_05145 [Candidatus Hydrogenedentota bacterium]|nr:MAG: hypothetical protein COA73_05145 [Candidatus Hydrogenedentota bacterium]